MKDKVRLRMATLGRHGAGCSVRPLEPRERHDHSVSLVPCNHDDYTYDKEAIARSPVSRSCQDRSSPDHLVNSSYKTIIMINGVTA